MEPVVNWKYIPHRFKYQAVDGNGDVYAFTHKPHPGNAVFSDVWDVDVGDCRFIGSLVIGDPIDLDWKQTLIERPTELKEKAA